MYLTLGNQIFKYHFGQYTQYAMSFVYSESDFYVLDNLKKVLKEQVGENIMNSYKPEKGYPYTFLVTTDATTSDLKPVLLSNYMLAKPLNDSATTKTYTKDYYEQVAHMPLYVAGCCSAAAPTYFRHMDFEGKTFVDGGIVANNASAIALSQAHELYPKEKLNLLLNLGTGDASLEVTKSFTVYKWGKKCVDIATESASLYKQACEIVKARYLLNITDAPAMVRLSPTIMNTQLDAAGDSTIKEWRVATDAHIKDKAKYIDTIVACLVDLDKYKK